jgi:hypothetical protein
MKARHEKASAETGGSQHHLYGPYRLLTKNQYMQYEMMK